MIRTSIRVKHAIVIDAPKSGPLKLSNAVRGVYGSVRDNVASEAQRDTHHARTHTQTHLESWGRFLWR